MYKQTVLAKYSSLIYTATIFVGHGNSGGLVEQLILRTDLKTLNQTIEPSHITKTIPSEANNINEQGYPSQPLQLTGLPTTTITDILAPTSLKSSTTAEACQLPPLHSLLASGQLEDITGGAMGKKHHSTRLPPFKAKADHGGLSTFRGMAVLEVKVVPNHFLQEAMENFRLS